MLTETEKVTNLLQVRVVNHGLVNKISLLLLGLLSQNVTVESVMSLNLSSTGESKSLLCAGVYLYFWHFCCCFTCSYYDGW